MALLESLAIGIGAAISKGVLKLWLKDEPLLLAASEKGTDLFSRHFEDYLARQEAKRQFEKIGERAARSILGLLDKEGSDLSEDQQRVVADAAAETIAQSPIASDLLVQANLDPGILATRFRELPGNAGGNPLSYASEAERALYDRILFHSAQLIVDIADQLPRFKVGVAAELLQGQDRLTAKANQIIDGIDRVLAAQGGADVAAAQFETDFRLACGRRFDQLELFGVDLQESNKRYKLSVAYVTLEVERTAILNPDVGDAAEDDELLREDREDDDSVLPEIMPVDRALASEPRLFVRGPAGSGKTTLLQWLAVFAAGRALEGDLQPLNDSVPFLIKLRELNDPAHPPAPEHFPGLVAALGGKPEHWAHQRLKSGKALVLIDGIDEALEEHRPQIQSWLKDLVSQYPEARYVATSRPHAAKEGWLAEQGFVDAHLRELGPIEIGRFVDHWHEAIGSAIKDPSQVAELPLLAAALKQQIARGRALGRLANSPLLCAMLCALYRDRSQQLPDDRLELYRACIDMFFRRDRERRVSMADYVSLNDRQARFLLEQLAWWMIRNGKSSASPSEAAGRVDRHLPQLTNRPQGATGQDVLRLFIERVGIMRRLSATKVDFPHRTFQEYLAACAAIAERDTGLLVASAHDDQWREVVVMAAGLLRNPGDADSFVRELIKRGDGDGDRRHVLYLLAATAMDAIQALPEQSDLAQLVTNRLSRIVPPSTMAEAEELATAGDLVVPLLKRKRGWGVRQAAACMRTLLLIQSDSAAEVFREWTKDRRKGLQKEILNAAIGSTEGFADLGLADPEAFAQVAESWVGENPRRRDWLLREIAAAPPRLVAPVLQRLRPTSINWRGTRVCDIGPLASCETLSDVSLAGTPINDISALAVCSALKRLDLSHSQVTSIAPVAGIPSLRELIVTGTPVYDLEPLRICSGLERLEVGNQRFSIHISPDGKSVTGPPYQSPIQTIDALRGCTHLRELGLHNTEVAEISALESCKSLETLVFWGAPLWSLVALRGAQKLKRLVLHRTKVDNIEGLENCPSLEVLYFAQSPIRDISPLCGAKRLKHLALVQTAVSDIAALGDALQTLEHLDLRGSPVADISPLRHCHALKFLDLQGTAVTDVGCLAECPNLSLLVVDPGRIVKYQLSELVVRAGGRLQIPYFSFHQFPLVLESDIEGTVANE